MIKKTKSSNKLNKPISFLPEILGESYKFSKKASRTKSKKEETENKSEISDKNLDKVSSKVNSRSKQNILFKFTNKKKNNPLISPLLTEKLVINGVKIVPSLEQKLAMKLSDVPSLVLGDSGTGKSSLLALKTLHLLDEGAASKQVLILHPNNVVANNFSAIIKDSLPKDSDSPKSTTIGNLAISAWESLNSSSPKVLSDYEAFKFFCRVNKGVPSYMLTDSWSSINYSRQNLQSILGSDQDYFNAYADFKSSHKVLDYFDLLLFLKDSLLNKEYFSQWTQILVDDVHRFSLLECSVISSFLGKSGEGFFGTAKSSAYYAKPDEDFTEYSSIVYLNAVWENLQVLALSKQYRFLGSVSVYRDLFLGKPLSRNLDEDFPLINYFKSRTAEEEASWVTSRIKSMLAPRGLQKKPMDEKIYPKDIAIFVRTEPLAKLFYEQLNALDIPACCVFSDELQKNEQLNLILSSLKQYFGIPTLDKSLDILKSCPERIIKNGPLGISAYLSTSRPFSSEFWDSSVYKDLILAYNKYEDWEKLLAFTSLSSNSISSYSSDNIKIIPYERATGMEFKVGFLPCLEEGITPFTGYSMLSGKLEKDSLLNSKQEFKLFYDVLSCISKTVVFSSSIKREFLGKHLSLKPSKYISFLPVKRLRLDKNTSPTELSLSLPVSY